VVEEPEDEELLDEDAAPAELLEELASELLLDELPPEGGGL
jgi:hypothetical protein